MYTVTVEAARRFIRHRAVTSTIRPFTIQEIGLESPTDLADLAEWVRQAPYDPYDPALAAENLVKRTSPALYDSHEAAWLDHWQHLHDDKSGADSGATFWLERAADSRLQMTIAALKPYRRRGSYQYIVTAATEPFQWHIAELGASAFSQSVGDSRARARRFPSFPRELVEHPSVLHLVAMACQLITQAPAVTAERFKVAAHLMLTYADVVGKEPAPEGRHQDGADYILSALVLERSNVLGGISKVMYNRDGSLALELQLKPGEGLLQSDLQHDLWHSVSTIYREDPLTEGFRSIFGLDICYA